MTRCPSPIATPLPTAAMVPPALRAHVDLPERALLVESVVGGTPADRMGMREFDILTHVNGQEVGSTEDIRRILTAAPNGEVSSVRVIRKGQALDLTAPKPR